MNRESFINTVIVDTGSFVVEKSSHHVLEAYLGTCVGVALYDSLTKVGGLLHLLLPEPVYSSPDDRPARYAATGLPLFLDALIQAGAVKENLRGGVAGGALVGRLTTLDLDLDVGGRTAEVVERILKQENIPIRKWETGGYFSCKLSLNLADGEIQIAPIGQDRVEAGLDGIHFNTVDVLLHAQQLRPIPQIALKITRMIADQDYSFPDVAAVVRQDQTISAKVINLCNSPIYRRYSPVDSIDRALTVLGEKNLLKLVVSAALEKLFPEKERGYSLVRGGLFQHAVGVGRAAARLARFTGLAPEDVAYTAGLLHDLGKVALDQFIAAAAPFFYRRTQIDGANLLTVESELFGTNHAEIGGRLAQTWGLPESLTEAIAFHHYPEHAPHQPDLVHLVYFADLLMSRFKVGLELDNVGTGMIHQRLKAIGLGPAELPLLVDALPDEYLDEF